MKYAIDKPQDIDGREYRTKPLVIECDAINVPLPAPKDAPFTIFVNGFEILCPAGTNVEKIE